MALRLVLAASAATCLAQANVYSLNIVGYVNVPVQGNSKLTLLSNPLKPSNGNYNITNTIVLPDTADGANLFTWAGTGWNTTVPGWYAGSGWYPDFNVNLGQSFFIQSPVAATVTFVGEVATGTNTYTMAPGINVVAPQEPVAAAWPGSANGHDGDNIFLWTGSAWDTTVWGYYAGTGWDNGGAAGNDVNGPTIPVGGGLVYQNTGTTPLTWTKTFTP